MNRRSFLHESSVALSVIAGLPQAIRQQKNLPSVYKTLLEEGVTGQTYYELGLYHATVQQFSAAPEEEKYIGLKVNFYGTTDQDTPTKSAEYKYLIKKVEQVDKEQDTWKITTKLDKKITGDYSLPKDFPKNLSFLCKPYSYVNILGRKDVVLLNIPYPEETSSGGGCFLTTACVAHKGLADDCEELAKLRFLRDRVMLQTIEGTALAAQYRKIGPAIIKAIGACENRETIYNYIYGHMIVPAVNLVKQGDYPAAVSHYKTFTAALLKLYC